MIAAALLGQLLEFNAAAIFGVLLVVDYERNASQSRALRPALATLAASAYLAVVGVAAWTLYSFLVAHPVLSYIRWEEIDVYQMKSVSDAAALATVALGEFLAIVTVTAASSLPLKLLPLRQFEGAYVWAWSRFAWIVSYALAIGLFVLIVVQPA